MKAQLNKQQFCPSGIENISCELKKKKNRNKWNLQEKISIDYFFFKSTLIHKYKMECVPIFCV